MKDILINKEFTDAEISAILRGLDMFIYENKYLNEEQYIAAKSAVDKICDEL